MSHVLVNKRHVKLNSPCCLGIEAMAAVVKISPSNKAGMAGAAFLGGHCSCLGACSLEFVLLLLVPSSLGYRMA